MSAMNELKRLLKEAQEQQKSNKEEIRIVQEEVRIVQEEDNSLVSKTASYLSAPRKIEPSRAPALKIEPTPVMTENIEAQRWNDPLRREAGEKFVTFKEMNDHYGLFLQRIQQQMSSIGGGGEVNLRYLDDLNFSTSGTNKYLTYDQATKKFIFDTVETGEGLYINGGNSVALSVASSSALGGIKVGSAFTMDGSSRLQLNAATNDIIGGVRLGPGVTTNNQGQIIISSEGLDFSFGDFQATVPSNGAATLSSVNLGQNIDIVSTANGVINAIGNFHVHTPATYDPIDPDANGAIFRVDAAGKVRMLVPDANTSEGAVSIVGGFEGVFQAPVNTGVMLHITGIAGTPGVPSRVYNDAQNAFAAFVARRYNNTAASPSAVLADEEIMRLSGTAHNGTLIPGTANQRIVYRALGNQSVSNAGGAIELWATPVNTTTLAKIATVDSVGITLESGRILTGNLTGNVTGNADTVTNGVYTSGDQTIGGTKTFSSTISGSISGTAGVATTVTLVATNSTAATHYLTFADSATGNENVRTDTDLTYNPGTGTLAVTKFSGKYVRNYRDGGVIADGGTVTIDFSTDAIVSISWDNSFTLAYQNYTAGSIVKLLANKRTGTGTDSFSLGGLTAGQVSTGSTTVAGTAGQTNFVELICTGTLIGGVYAKL